MLDGDIEGYPKLDAFQGSFLVQMQPKTRDLSSGLDK